MTRKFMILVARALYLLILMGIAEYPYLSHGNKVDTLLKDLMSFYQEEDNDHTT